MEVVVLRCSDCGDTFAVHADAERVCPSCGSHAVDTATEPLL